MGWRGGWIVAQVAMPISVDHSGTGPGGLFPGFFV
jgi:hypothetical protein